MENKEKPLAVVHVDVDCLWAIKQDLGQVINRNDCITYGEAIPQFLEIFDKENIKATFFAIGDDAKRNIGADMIQQMAAKGHEIANHTMNHRTDFTRITLHEMSKEIIECDTILSQVTNTNLIGFRSPGYFLTESLVNTLIQLGYRYDTSCLPTILLPLMNLGHLFLSGFNKTNKRLGRMKDVFRGLKPYYLNSTGIKSTIATSNNILEIPISVIPNIRFPFHSTMVFLLGEYLFNIGIKSVKFHNLPLIYLFHAVDLYPDINYKVIMNHPTLRLNFSKRQHIVKNIIRKINHNFQVVSTLDFINSFSK